MYLLKLALRPWRIALASQLFAAVAVTVLLVLTGFLYWLQDGLKPVLERLQGEQVITVYLAAENEPAEGDGSEEGRIVDAIRTSLGASEHYDLKVIDPRQFVGHLKTQFPELAREIEDLGPEMDTVVPRYVSITGVLPDAAVSRIKAIAGIESAESSKDRYAHVVGAFRALRWMAKLLCAGLAVALLTGLIHLARMNSFLHRDSLLLLRFWGASESTLKAPAILSALSVGALGGALACVSWIIGGGWLAHEIRALSPMLREMPISGGETLAVAATLLVAGALIGIAAGLLGSSSLPRAYTGAVAGAAEGIAPLPANLPAGATPIVGRPSGGRA